MQFGLFKNINFLVLTKPRCGCLVEDNEFCFYSDLRLSGSAFHGVYKFYTLNVFFFFFYSIFWKLAILLETSIVLLFCNETEQALVTNINPIREHILLKTFCILEDKQESYSILFLFYILSIDCSDI